ncbi:hypothetical protein [Stakelama pacifica]|uniref:Uncharacterized protein n=1 Tax=Stakelama pacifica TaxID=517720 RepID=A0A4R6FQD5_9SPHN|nr:hypothetical protein [Stakelama pacifica]TDN83004.1 hypothetical protein EV664_105202 [Stakelama pacifica]GGO94954.1 hypothetical protein GCM10011329_18000 [Stakelama pacifica]
MSDFIQGAILAAIKAEAERIVTEEVENAQCRVSERLSQVAPAVAMAVFRDFDIHKDRDRLTISVRNDLHRVPSA